MATRIVVLCFVIVSIFLENGCQADVLPNAFTCDGTQSGAIPVQLGDDAHRRTASISANLVASADASSNDVRTCIFHVFTNADDHKIFFRLTNFTVSSLAEPETSCDNASVKLYDIYPNSFSESDLVEKYCTTLDSSIYVSAESSLQYAFIVHVVTKGPFSVNFKAAVFDMPAPCGYFCAADNRCLTQTQRCDYFKDCNDGSDEAGCNYLSVGQDNNAGIADREGFVIADAGSKGNPADNAWLHSDFDGMDDVLVDRFGYSKTRDSGCNNPKVQKGDQGSFTSLGYPCRYGPRLNCSWEITVPPGKVILVNFNKIFGLEEGTQVEGKTTCEGDYLNFYYRRSPTEPEQLAQSICGQVAPKTFYLKAASVRVQFRSDDAGNSYGFRLQWAAASEDRLSQVRSDPRTSRLAGSVARPTLPPLTGPCAPGTRGEVLTNLSGTLTSPMTKKGQYVYDSSCAWVISGTADQVISLFFAEFALEQSDDCSFDFVDIYDGNELYGRFCGKEFIPPFISKSNKVMINFTSDKHVEDKGFVAYYRIAEAKELEAWNTRHGDRSGKTKVFTTVQKQASTPVVLATTQAAPVVTRPLPATPGPIVKPSGVIGGSAPTTTPEFDISERGGNVSGAVMQQSDSKLKKKRRSLHSAECGTVPGNAFGAMFGDTCYGALVLKRWLLSTTNCLAVDNSTSAANLNFATVNDWATRKSIGQVKQISIKSFKFRGENSLSAPLQFTGLSLVQLDNVPDNLTTPAITCLPTDSEDDDQPDASCIFPRPPLDWEKKYDMHKLSNDKCYSILQATKRMTVPADRLHLFECFLAQDVDMPDDSKMVSNFRDLAVQPAYCEVSSHDRYKALFNEFPLKFCNNYESKWTISGVLVQVLTSNETMCNDADNKNNDEQTPQLIAVYVRVSHFFEWIFSITGNAAVDANDNFIRNEELNSR